MKTHSPSPRIHHFAKQDDIIVARASADTLNANLYSVPCMTPRAHRRMRKSPRTADDLCNGLSQSPHASKCIRQTFSRSIFLFPFGRQTHALYMCVAFECQPSADFGSDVRARHNQLIEFKLVTPQLRFGVELVLHQFSAGSRSCKSNLSVFHDRQHGTQITSISNVMMWGPTSSCTVV